MTSIGSPLVLNEDVLIIPAADLSEEAREGAGCGPDDFAVTRTRGRGGSSIVDTDSAKLLDRFRAPRTVVDAVILYARERGLEPASVLETAYPLIRGMVQRQVLVPATSAAGETAQQAATMEAGRQLPFGSIARTLQVLDDTEVHLVTLHSGLWAVLKIERQTTPVATAAVTRRLAHEALVLSHLGGRVAPALIGQGELDGRAYLLMEFVAGTDVASAAAEWRGRDDDENRATLLGVLRAVADAYAALHAAHVLHGDVHPRNALLTSDGRVRLIDFGLSQGIDPARALPRTSERGGVPFFFDPELARAHLDGTTPPAVTALGEQFSLAALLYTIATGSQRRNFRLAREEMLQDITDGGADPFRERGLGSWPELERLLARALAPDPSRRFASVAELASALTTAKPASSRRRQLRTARPLLYDSVVDALGSASGPITAPLPAPSASVTYGAAGIAVGLLHVAQRRESPALLAAADAWLHRARRERDDETGFYNPEIEITRPLVGESSPYHTPSGLDVTDALIARATADRQRQHRAIERFLIAAARPAAGLDITLGQSSTLLGATLLLDAASPELGDVSEELRAFGDRTVSDLWRALDAKPRVGEGDVQYLGIAHGWAGFLYATLQWSAVSGSPLPPTLEQRLSELAALALPSGRGLEWPWILQPGDPPTMPGWCNGSCGYVFLWTLAHRMLSDARYLDLAIGAAWNSWESAEQAATLCCGLAGRGYALANLYRLTGDAAWLTRARELCARGAAESAQHPEYPHSLYKGGFGVAVLAADLERPGEARMPFFEVSGWRS